MQIGLFCQPALNQGYRNIVSGIELLSGDNGTVIAKQLSQSN